MKKRPGNVFSFNTQDAGFPPLVAEYIKRIANTSDHVKTET